MRHISDVARSCALSALGIQSGAAAIADSSDEHRGAAAHGLLAEADRTGREYQVAADDTAVPLQQEVLPPEEDRLWNQAVPMLQLQEIAARELQPFRQDGGITLATLGLPFLWTEEMGHGLLRIRILSGKVYVKKLVGAPFRGTIWSDRQMQVLEGFMSLVEQEDLPDVDFVVGLLDNPICEAYNAKLPVFVFAKKADCPNILMPDHSLLHNGYQWGTGGSPFHWHAIVGQGLATTWDDRISGGIYWDGGFGKGWRWKLREAEHMLLQPERSPTSEESLDRFNMNHYDSPAVHCSYKLSLNAQGNSWSMRLKNIFLCRTAAVMSLPPPEARYAEYWHEFLQEGTHYFAAHSADTRGGMERILALSETEIEAVAAAGFKYAAAMLHPRMVRLYLATLLQQYSKLQLFTPAQAHAADRAGFTLVTRAELEYVQDHASALQSQYFHFHFPERADLALSPSASGGRGCEARGFGSPSLHNVPCWGTMHRFLHCCKAKNIWAYSPGRTEEWEELHPFCRAPELDPALVWKQCCNRTVVRIQAFFRNSIGKHPPAQILDFLGRSILDLRLDYRHAYALLELARDVSLQRIVSDMKPNVAVFGSDSSIASVVDFERHLHEAWFFEETLQLTCTLRQVMRNEGAGPCRRSSVFSFLADLRERHRRGASQPLRISPLAWPAPLLQSHSTWGYPAAASRGSVGGLHESPLDIVILLGSEPNSLALKSLLVNRGCPLRLHLLLLVQPQPRRGSPPAEEGAAEAPGQALTAWVQEELARHMVEDVIAEALPHMGVRSLLLPHRWMPKNLSALSFFDFSRPERGPLFVGDVCQLPMVFDRLGGPGAAIYAPRHLEFARWSETQFGVDVFLLDMNKVRQRSVARILRDERRRVLVTMAPQDDVSSPHAYLQAWVRAVHGHGHHVLTFLPYGWWFVPFEPWFYDSHWEDVLEIPWMRRLWEDVLAVREYPGFDGLSRTLRLYCPPAAHWMPVAVQYNWFLPELMYFRSRQLYAEWWKRYVHACDAPVFVLGLQWERAEGEPRIPFPVRDLPFVQSLIREYEFV